MCVRERENYQVSDRYEREGERDIIIKSVIDVYACERQTDRQTDRQTETRTVFSIPTHWRPPGLSQE